jgi:hypothetical protein
MTVRRVSRRRRRHLRQTAKGPQKGGAYLYATEWAAAVKDLYDKTGREYRDSNNEFIIDKLAELAPFSDNVHISIDGQSFLLKEVAARVAVFMYNFKNQDEHTYTSYMNWYTTLDSDELTKLYKTELLKIENAIRILIKEKLITDIGLSEGFPLYVWALVFKAKSEEELPPVLASPETVNKEIEKTRSEELEKKRSETSSSTNQTINQEEPVLQGGSAP